jgi:hypothetical protein
VLSVLETGDDFAVADATAYNMDARKLKKLKFLLAFSKYYEPCSKSV